VILLAEASSVMQPYWHRREEFGPDVLTLFDQGRLVPATQYVNAQRVRREMIRDYARMFEQIDVLLTPATPMPAPRIGQTTIRLGDSDEDTRLSATRFMRGINVLGNPAMSIPCGWSAAGLPLGLHLVGKPWSERILLDCAAAMEQALMPAVSRSPAASA
jgi:aspartyl-tRNA(Asn)/glutamyl-tRNA(Gln) amidotransferase subunit A